MCQEKLGKVNVQQIMIFSTELTTVKAKTFIRKRRRRLLTLVTVNILTPSQESKNTKKVVPESMGGA